MAAPRRRPPTGDLLFVTILLAVNAAAHAESYRVEVEGATLHVEADGSAGAPALLLWNGAGCTTHMWDEVVPRLDDRFRVLRFDVRGTGQSSASESQEQYRFEQYAEDALAVLEHFGYEESLVWSMAWGSRAAVAYAALHPSRVKLLALYDASVDRADVEAQAAGREKAFAAQEAAGIPLFERPEGWNLHRDQEEMRRALAAARRFEDLPGRLPEITAPTLVATGDHDPNLASSRRIAEEIRDARLVVMENVGHGSVLQRPDLATEIFLAFVDQHEAALD